MHLVKVSLSKSMVTMLKASVLLTAEILAGISGHLQQPFMRQEMYFHNSSVLVLTDLLLHLQHYYLALSEMTIFVILVVQSKLMASFMVMIHCGMEQVVGL